jgi:predicted NBD/HSP70 family sugar kinase
MSGIGLKTLLAERRVGSPSGRIVRTLSGHGALSATQLAGLTGLAKSTVSMTLSELRKSGVVVESHGAVNGRGSSVGRPATVLTLNPRAGTCVGVVIGLGEIKLIVADVSHTIIADKTQPMESDYSPEEAIAVIQRLIREAYDENSMSTAGLLGVGVAVSGPVNPLDSRVQRASVVPTWAGIEIRKVFEPALERPIFADNESNCAALAEMMWGAAVGHADFVLFKIDLGVGGAIVSGGRVITGIAGGGGEFGHISLDPNGELCRCGNRGCLELYASFRKPLAYASKLFGRTMTSDDVILEAGRGHRGCQRLIEDTAEIAGRGLAMIGTILNPGLIVVAGRLALAGDKLLEPLVRSYERHTLVKREEVPPAARTKFAIGKFIDNDSCMGAVGLVLRHHGSLA